MAVTSVDILRKEGRSDEKGSYETWTYQVQFDAVPSSANDALTADDGVTSLPSIGDSLASDTTMKVRSIGPAEIMPDEWKVVHVPVEFSDVSRGGSSPTQDPNPLLRPADVDGGFEVVERVAEKDKDGNAIENKAGDPFDPPVMEEEYRLRITIERNVATHDWGDALDKVGTCNNASITIAGATVAAGQALLRQYSATAVYENGVSFARQRFDILFAPTFDREIANRGFQYIDASDGNKVKAFLDEEGRPMSEPQWLTAGGDDGAGSANYLTFSTKDQTDWSTLSLPTTFPDV